MSINVKVVSLNVHSDGASLAPPSATTGAPAAAGTAAAVCMPVVGKHGVEMMLEELPAEL